MRLPSLEIAIEINRVVRDADEWFDDDPDDLNRIQVALSSVEGVSDPILAAAIVAYRVTRAQAFAEGNKRTALLLARWLLDHNGVDGATIIPSDDQLLPALLVKAASGSNVEDDLVALLVSRR